MDHETKGAKEWEIPEYSLKPDRACDPPESSLQIVNRSAASRPARGPVGRQYTRNAQGVSASVKLPVNSVGVGHALPMTGLSLGSRGRGNPSFMRGLSRASQFQRPSRFPKDSQAKAKWRAGLRPTETFRLPFRYGTYKQHILQAAKDVLGGVAVSINGKYEVFEQISQKTGAFVKQPSYNDQEICVWGESHQVSAAKDLVFQIVKQCNALAFPKKKQDWAKITAHSLIKEDRIDYKEKRLTLTQQLRRSPNLSSKAVERLLFLWPNGELPMREVLGPELEVLDSIRIEFGCNIYAFHEVPEYICVIGEHHEALCEVARRIRTKWHELMATSNVRSKVYLTEPPESGTVSTGIIVKKVHGFAKASISRRFLTEVQFRPWKERVSLIQSKNEGRLLSAVERSLQGLPFFRGHLRMRVNIGSFILDEYRLPRDAQTGYSFEEFREMLLHDKTKGRLVPGLDIDQHELMRRCSLASHLLQPLGVANPSLEDVEPKYTVNFEFEGSDNAVLRLEAEFVRHGGAQEYEAAQRRWVKSQLKGQFTDGRPPLQAVSVDFERADWQLEIKAVQFHDPSNLSAAIQSFNRELAFRKGVATETLSTKPKRRVIIPEWAPVCRVIEKAAVQYPLKNTGYTLEIARYDEYRRISGSIPNGRISQAIRGKMSDVPNSTWGASIFSTNWDNLLGQHAKVGVGKVAHCNATLKTFFPPKGKDDGDMHAGFWGFISLVKEVAALLGKDYQDKSSRIDAAITDPPKIDSGSQVSHSVSSNEPTKVLDADLGTMF